LKKQELKAYKKPFNRIASRKPMLKWPREIPINKKPSNIYRITTNYNRFLQQTDIPKLLFYGTPGAILTEEQVSWCNHHLKNLTTHHLGRGLHFLQEDYPGEIGKKIKQWLDNL
jgi:haloalkane dehalogenase